MIWRFRRSFAEFAFGPELHKVVVLWALWVLFVLGSPSPTKLDRGCVARSRLCRKIELVPGYNLDLVTQLRVKGTTLGLGRCLRAGEVPTRAKRVNTEETQELRKRSAGIGVPACCPSPVFPPRHHQIRQATPRRFSEDIPRTVEGVKEWIREVQEN